MTGYRFRAARPDGGLVGGIVNADDASQAGAVLAERGLYPIALARVEAAERRPAASRRDLAIAFRGIAALVAAGVPLAGAVAATEPLAAKGLRDTLNAARRALGEGRTFAEALAAGPGAVPGVVLGILRAGERGSQLARALDAVASHLEQEADLVARVRQVLAYPLVLAVAGTASILVIATTVVPGFAALLTDLGQDLPLATGMMLGGSAVLSRFWLLGVLCVVGAVWGTARAWRNPTVRERVHAAALATPLVGPLRLSLASARVSRALGGMLSAGMPLLSALEAAGDAAGDLAVARRLRRAREDVAQGTPLAAALEREVALSPSALQLVAVGELSGRLGDMTQRAGDLAAQDAERGLRTLVTLLEPVLILAFGGLIAFVAVALLQAVYSLRPGGF